jgi:SET domain-containing protein
MSDDTYRPTVKVKRSSAGLGLFAGEAIEKDQLIIEYTGERISEEEANKRGGRYLFQVTDTLVIDGKGRENTARYINHACRPNAEAEHDEEEDRIYIRACKNIKEGDEITYHYGKEYMKEIIKKEGCLCATCLKKKEKQQKAEAEK